MKFSYLIKSTPLLSTLILIIILTVSNQKDNTRLRILIWETPSLALGTYLSLSACTGFILSYFITTNFAKTRKSEAKYSLKFKDEKQYEETYEQIKSTTNEKYDNTLIERDIKDPLPTVNASFRIIGRKENSNINYINDNNTENNDSIELEDQYYEQIENIESKPKVRQNTSDWNDHSFSKW